MISSLVLQARVMVIPNHRFLVAMLTDAVLALHMHTFTHNQISLLEYSVLFTRAAVHTHAHEHLETRETLVRKDPCVL